MNSVHKASARSGDAQARGVARFLLERAAVPYIRMLEKWIFYGELEDPHKEFMVCVCVCVAVCVCVCGCVAVAVWLCACVCAGAWSECRLTRLCCCVCPHQVKCDDSLSKDSMRADPEARYWADCYTVQDEQVPMFLSSLEEDILTTGKYLNVLRGGETPVESPVAISIPFAEGT